MKKPIKITLADQGYDIEQLNLMQLRDLNVGVVKATPEDPVEKVKASFDDALDTIATALSVKYPEMTKEKMLLMPITEEEMVAAVRVVLRFAGLIRDVAEGSQTGEGAAVASTGDGSSVGSAAA
jgi:hypothetical protein